MTGERKPAVNGAAKIFCIGYSKTGTTSLAQALEILGFRTYRTVRDGTWPPESEFDAATHEYVADRFDELDRQHPGSRFIVTERDRENWIASAEPFYRGTWEEKSKDELLNDYDGHYGRVRSFFADRSGDVLFVDIIANPDWQPLCGFLGVPVPEVPFPHENQRDWVVARRKRKRLFHLIRPFIPSFARTPIKRLFCVDPLVPDGFGRNTPTKS